MTLLYLRTLRSNLDSPFIQNLFDADDLAFCDDILCKMSRSFEDDMTYFPTAEAKIATLLSFYKTALVDPAWSMMGCGIGDERRLFLKMVSRRNMMKAWEGRYRCYRR
ncbi:hypothetical protein ACHAXA_006121 [Cyclostephanos tholiformis]|uniref:Uncharacterized protein n=1 Tax=Cyclostephanos tholiformis TaxID=382380 RepID=A0ABD3REQ4_9STRA